MRARYRLPLALAVIVAGGVCGFLTAHLSRIGRSQGAVDTTTVTAQQGAPGPAQEPAEDLTGGAAPAHPIPTDVPDVALPDAEGLKHRLSEWKGRPLLINFWATWCEPCRREIPLLKTLRQERAADGLEIVGIAVDLRDAVRRYAHEMGIDYPVLIGEQDGLDAITAFGMDDAVFPFSVFSDRQGRIVTLKVGELHPEDARFILDQIRAVDRGQIELPAARKKIADGIAALAAERARQQAR